MGIRLELSIDISTARDGYFTVTVVPANDKINWHLTAGATDGSASFSHDGYGTQSFEVNSNGTYPGKTFIASVWNYEVNASVEETWWQ